MKRIDREIFEIENRLRTREAVIRQTAVQTRQRTVQSLKSPVAIGGAVVVGFLLAGTLGRRRAKKQQVLAQDTKQQSKGFALGTLLMTGATWFVRSQFGGPVGLAQFVLSKVKGKSGHAPATQPPSPAHDSRSAQFTR
jgi:hypothetical protein